MLARSGALRLSTRSCNAGPVGEVNAQSSPRGRAREKTARIREFRSMVRARHPGFVEAVLADARVTSRNRGRPLGGASRSRVALEALRLAWESDGFLAQALYRAKAAGGNTVVEFAPTEPLVAVDEYHRPPQRVRDMHPHRVPSELGVVIAR